MSKGIPLTGKYGQGKAALVDDCDFERVSAYSWYATTKGYASRSDYTTGRRTLVLMHRFIMNAPANMEVDHINHDVLDCRRSNLRLATVSQNQANSRVHKDSSSGVKGVFFVKGKWVAQIRVSSKLQYLGRFVTIRAAAEAYNKAALELSGEYAHINDLSLLPAETEPPKVCPSSKCSGVSWAKHLGKWRARVTLGNKRIHLGYFPSENEAAQAYDTFVAERGLNKPLNYPVST